MQIQRDLALASGHVSIGRAFVDGPRRHCHRLAGLQSTLARARPEFGQGLRSLPHGNYIIFFRYSGNQLEIATILHGSRDLDKLFPKDS